MLSHKTPITRRAFVGLQATAALSLLGCGAAADDTSPDPGAGSAAAPRTVGQILGSGTLRVAICSDNRPLGYIDTDGNYSGIDQYFCLYLADRMGGPSVEFVCVDPRDRYGALDRCDVDLSVAGMSPWDEQAADHLFSNPLYQLRLALVSPSDAPITSEEELGQGPLIVCEGSHAEQYARDAWPDVPLLSYTTLSAARDALERGEGVAFLDDELPAASWIRNRPQFTLGMAQIGEARPVAVAANPGQDELIAAVNDAVRRFLESDYAPQVLETHVTEVIGERYADGLFAF